MKGHVLIYLVFVGLLITGIYLIVNPYIEYLLYVCVTVNHQTTCHYETIRSFKFPILVTGVVGTISSIGNIIIYTIVTVTVERRKKRRRSIVDSVNNS
jgi:hypothetical protein